MKKLSLILSLLFASLFHTIAQNAIQVDEALALTTAQAFVQTQMALKGQEPSLVSSQGNYIYNIGDQGFVIIAGNTVLPPILGYSDQSNFPDLTEAPENVTSWIGHYAEMIDFATANGIQPDSKVQRQWEEAAKGIFGTRNANTVDPLVTTHWNQDCFYNEYCPDAPGHGWGGWGGGP